MPLIVCRRIVYGRVNLGQMDLRSRFAKNVRRARQARELSQEELATQAGLHRTYVSDIERGRRNPTLGVIQRLADALGVEPASLLSKEKR